VVPQYPNPAALIVARRRIAMNRNLTTLVGGLLCCATTGWVTLDAQEGEKGARVPFPTGYRLWAVVKTKLVGPQSQTYSTRGGFHHFYANEKALEGYRTGKFPDGSIIVDEGVYASEADGITREGELRSVEIMHKDSSLYASTGGWGYERFEGERQVSDSTLAARTVCFKCHATRKDSDYVFSVFRK
jgi:hypothetical protein